jgi:hypothetical protein
MMRSLQEPATHPSPRPQEDFTRPNWGNVEGRQNLGRMHHQNVSEKGAWTSAMPTGYSLKAPIIVPHIKGESRNFFGLRVIKALL